MPLPVIANVIRAAIEGHTVDNKPWANVMHFRKTGALSYTGAIAILDPLLIALYGSVFGGQGPMTANWHTGQGVDQIVYTPLDGTSASQVFPHAVNGSTPTDALPASVSLVATVYTALRGRAHRGRFYMPPFNEGLNTAAGDPSGTLVTSTQTVVSGWFASLTGTGVSLGVASYRFVSFEDAVSCLVRSHWSTQRRRLG